MLNVMKTTRYAERAFYTEAPLDLQEVEGVIRGYVFIWGDAEHRDAYGTYFDRNRPPDIGGDIGDFRRPISYEHNDDGAIRIDRIGEIRRVWFDDIGLAFEGQLDRSSPWFPKMVNDVRAGRLKTSSATAEHTAAFYDDGAFRAWWLVEEALTETPAERRMPQVELVRKGPSAEATDDLSRAEVAQPDALSFDATPNPERNDTTMSIDELLGKAQEEGISLEELHARLMEMQKPAEMSAPDTALADGEMDDDEDEPVAMTAPATPARSNGAQKPAVGDDIVSRLLSIETALRSLQAAPAQTDERRKPSKRSGEGVNYNQIPDRKYANLSAPEMWMLSKVWRDHGKRISADFTRSMTEKTFAHLEQQQKARQDGKSSAEIDMFMRSYKTKRADEIMATNIAGQGTEWVGVMYSDVLWEAARVAVVYRELLSAGMMEMALEPGTNSVYIPTEGADPTFYSAPEANDISSGRIEVTSNPQFVGTGRQLVTPKVLKATVAWSEELDEDSLIPMAAWLNTQLQRAAQEVIEYVMINGDTVTSGTTNLNLIDGTPGTGASRPAYLATDGFFKLPIITTTSLSYDAGNTMSEDLFLEVIKKFPAALQANKQQRLRFLLGVYEETAALNIPAVKTRDINSQATIEGGSLQRMWGVPVLVSGQINKANSAGKIAGTNPTTTNIYGRILAVAPQYWAFVMNRNVRFKVSEDPYNDATLMRVSLRMGVQYRSTNAAAAAYEVAV